MNLFRYAPLIIRWTPFVYSAVMMVEELIGPGRTGEEKKSIALTWLSETAEKLELEWGEHVISILDHLVDAAVSMMNLLGYFRHGVDIDDEEMSDALVEADETTPALVQNVTARVERDPALQGFIAKTLVE